MLLTMSLLSSTTGKVLPRGDATVETHTMGNSLTEYLRIKVHQSVLERPYDEIIIAGAHNRSPPAIIFDGEKLDKPFNWQRPTARVVGNRLYIECFPGYDHAEHYAEITAAYLRTLQKEGNGKELTPPSKVSFIPPTTANTLEALKATNLPEFPNGVDIVILGLVHRLG
jgi:hypothetical protein